MLSRLSFDSEGGVGEVAGTIASGYLYVLELDSVLLEVLIVSNIHWFGLLCDL